MQALDENTAALQAAATPATPAAAVDVAQVVTPAAPSIPAPAISNTDRDAAAAKAAPGILQDLLNIAQTTGDTDATFYLGPVAYRQVDTNFKESITDSLVWAKAQAAPLKAAA